MPDADALLGTGWRSVKNRPRAMIFNISPCGFHRSPKTMLTFLLLGQGFDLGAEFVDAVSAAWERLLATLPLSDVAALRIDTQPLQQQISWAPKLADPPEMSGVFCG